jgi:LysR family nitrogen assimilation transcriptional regulator
MGKKMELRHLRNFLVVVEQGSISKAADVIGLAQPALSRQLQALEADLGAALLYRHGWGITPTPAGEILLSHSKNLLNQARTVRDAVNAVSGLPAGKLAIGVPSSIAAVLLPALVFAARETLPHVELRLIEGYSANLRQRLLASELDFAILYAEKPQAGFVSRPLLREPLVAIGPAGMFSLDQSISMADLIGRSPIMPGYANQLRSLFENAAAEAGLLGSYSMEVDSVPALIELVSAGAGVSILPYSAIYRHVAEGRLSYAHVAPEKLERHLALARPAERIETPSWNAVMELLYKIIASHQDICGWTMIREA